MKVYEALAEAFIGEGVDTVFGLMGDGNMNWIATMATRGVSVYHARHENAAAAMADGYARTTGRVGVCSVTSGPGLTQIGTTLVTSVLGRTPMVVFTGDTPMNNAFNIQDSDQQSYALAVGALYREIRSTARIPEQVQEAFYLARFRRLPVVLSIPWDLQDEQYPWEFEYRPSSQLLPTKQRPAPDPEVVARIVQILEGAERPVIVAGAGAVASGARAEIEELGDRIGALMATALRGKGFFDGHEFNLGVAGAFSSAVSRELMVNADVVIGVGARMGHFTTEGGYLFPNATIIQIDLEPQGYVDGMRVADLYLQADAAAGVAAITDALGERKVTGYRTEEVRERVASDPGDTAEFEVEPGTIDPRVAIREINEATPPESLLVIGAGHFWNFAVFESHGRPPQNYMLTYDFGVIGQGLPSALGAAVGRPDRPVVLIEGDGSIMMNVQVLETQARHGIPALTFIMNDGAYGAEVHKLRFRGLPPDESIHGLVDLAAVASAFGVEGHRVTDKGQIGPIVASFHENPRPTLVDVRMSPSILSYQYRRLYLGQE